jgi:hypothetical protein
MGHRFKPVVGYVLEDHLPLGEGGGGTSVDTIGVKNFFKRGIFLMKNKERWKKNGYENLPKYLRKSKKDQ